MSKATDKAQDTKRLNYLIEKLGLESITVDDEGTPITRFEQLARIIWNKALGYTERDEKTGAEIKYNPDKHFIDMIYDRMEGKIPAAASGSDGKKASLADRVSDQTKSRLNALAGGDD